MSATNSAGTQGNPLMGITPAALDYDVGVDWANGQANPVDQTIGMNQSGKGGSLDVGLHVTVKLASQ